MGSKVGLPQLSVLQEEWNSKSGPKGATFEQFKSLMHQLEQLYQLYDLDHNNLIMIFNAFDNNLDNKISKKEFTKAVRKFCAPYRDYAKKDQKEFVNRIFQECDADNNGYLTLQEFVAWTRKDPESFKTVVGLLGAEL